MPWSPRKKPWSDVYTTIVFCGEAVVVEVIEHAADVVVDRCDDAQILLDVALVAPTDLFVLVEPVRHGRLEVDDGIEVHHPHSHGLDDFGAAGQVVAKCVWFGDVDVVVHREVLGARFPRSVRRLVMTEQGERLVADAVEEVETIVGDEIGDVSAAFDDGVRSGLQHDGVVVVALAGEHSPIVETGRVVRRTMAEVPLAEQRRLVAGGLQRLRKRPQRVVQQGVERGHAVHVVVRAGEDGGTARRADRVGAEHGVEAHPPVGDAIDVEASG